MVSWLRHSDFNACSRTHSPTVDTKVIALLNEVALIT